MDFQSIVVEFYDDQHHESQYTVVTETHGALTGQRVVPGREIECREYYEQSGQSSKNCRKLGEVQNTVVSNISENCDLQR